MGRRAPKAADDGPRHTPRLAARSVTGHLLRTRDETWAWFHVPTIRWSFRDDASREAAIHRWADQLAELEGLWCHLRVTSRPYPVSEWARGFVGNSRPLADVAGAVSWAEFVDGEQRALAGWALSDKQVFLGVQVGTRTLTDRACQTRGVSWLLARAAPELLSTEHAEVQANLDRAAAAVAALGGRSATPVEMDWLLHRSCSLGLSPGAAKPVPTGEWDTLDLDSYADETLAWQEPQAPTVRVKAMSGRNAGREQSVAVLSIGQMGELDIPQRDWPWMIPPDVLAVPAEWSARFHVRPRDVVAGELAHQADKARHQKRHYEQDHEIPAPASLERQTVRAAAIDDELSAGVATRATRLVGYWRLAVSGATEEEAVAVADAVAERYKPRVRIEHPTAQYKHAREFVPGEPIATKAHRRRGSVTWAASAVPTVAHQVGDQHGPVIGQLAVGAPRPVAWDPWASMERRGRSGLTGLVGGLGSGKSALGFLLLYKTLRAGAEWTVLDPSGPLAKLCDLPELAPYAQHVALDPQRSEPGLLNPWRVVPEPSLEHFADADDPETELAREREHVAQVRRDLVLDVMKRMLPHHMQGQDTDFAMDKAVDAVHGRADAHPGLVITALRNLRDETPELCQHARRIADAFDTRRSKLRLLIPEPGREPEPVRTKKLTVVTMPGLDLPKPDTPQAEWNDTQVFNTQLLMLAAWLTQHNLYNRPRSARKGVWIDEAFFLSTVPAGRSLINRIARDSRKHNIRALLSSQVAQDLLHIPRFAALCDAVLLGHLDGHEAQAEALELAGVPTGMGYEDTLADLPHPETGEQLPREFVFADGDGQVERIRCDFSAPHLAHVLAAADTTPRQPPAEQPVPAAEWAPDPAGNGNGHTPQFRYLGAT